jgi:hypothetical protein
MQQPCSAYPEIWDYSFKADLIELGWMIVPLATFASDYNGQCRIFVRYKEYMLDGSTS